MNWSYSTIPRISFTFLCLAQHLQSNISINGTTRQSCRKKGISFLHASTHFLQAPLLCLRLVELFQLRIHFLNCSRWWMLPDVTFSLKVYFSKKQISKITSSHLPLPSQRNDHFTDLSHSAPPPFNEGCGVHPFQSCSAHLKHTTILCNFYAWGAGAVGLRAGYSTRNSVSGLVWLLN